MKILWLVNIPLPEVSLLMGERSSPYGGWLINLANNLSNIDGVELVIVFPHGGKSFGNLYKGERVTYIPFAPIKYTCSKRIKYNSELDVIVKQIKPDLVHIHGTEFMHSLAMVNVCRNNNIKFVISIQGLVSIIERHMFADLPFKVIYGATFRNVLLRDNVSNLRNSFIKRGKKEIKAIEKAGHIVGRTTWDRVCTNQINPNTKYYSCNETLRDKFYKYEWDIKSCEKYSIFLSQAAYPIKGLHYVLEAMAIVLKEFPQTKLYISGKDIIGSITLRDRLLQTYYGKYINRLIKKFRLSEKVVFTGSLDEGNMCARFLKSHVFVSASTIENESNSLSEAKILGVPVVASYVGGVIDRINHGVDGYVYQHDAPYMMAHYIMEIFKDDSLAKSFSCAARENALLIHDKEKNLKKMIDIYNEIIK